MALCSLVSKSLIFLYFIRKTLSLRYLLVTCDYFLKSHMLLLKHIRITTHNTVLLRMESRLPYKTNVLPTGHLYTVLGAPLLCLAVSGIGPGPCAC